MSNKWDPLYRKPAKRWISLSLCVCVCVRVGVCVRSRARVCVCVCLCELFLCLFLWQTVEHTRHGRSAMTMGNLCWVVAVFVLAVTISEANAEKSKCQCNFYKLNVLVWIPYNGFAASCKSKKFTQIPKCIYKPARVIKELYVLVSIGCQALYPNR